MRARRGKFRRDRKIYGRFMKCEQAASVTEFRGERLETVAAAAELIGILRLRKLVRFARQFAGLRMTSLLLMLWVVTSAVSVAQTLVPVKALIPLEQTLISSEKSLIEAKKKDDGAFFKQMVSEDFVLVGVDGKLLERQEAVDGLGDSGLVELTPYDIKVVAAGEGAAIVSYDAIVREKPEEDQGPPPRYQHFSSVWVKQGDGWKLKFHQATAAHWGDW